MTGKPSNEKSQDGPESETPQSPEKQAEYVRDELDQENITHQGDYRTAANNPRPNEIPSQHLGATDDEVVPITPPMAGPADLVGKKNVDAQGNEDGDTEVGEETYDPRDELTPG
ncbi:MAG TPA: hypothetical protein VLQ48_16790 [Chloroflexia bacterium]|nr:hypothetical protein [Chloroflexia bacterium]